MHGRLAPALRALVAICATSALAGIAVAAPPPPTALKVPHVDYRERKLSNGLDVISVESHSSPTVDVQVWHHVGGRDDPAGRSGFAHLFEHMMFKSSKYLAAEQRRSATTSLRRARRR
jgi:zinc protease